MLFIIMSPYTQKYFIFFFYIYTSNEAIKFLVMNEMWLSNDR